MNKIIIIAFAVFAVINSVQSTDSGEVISKVKSKHLKKLLTEKKDTIDEGLEKLEEQCPGVSEKIKSALVSFQECDDKTDDSLTICTAIQTYTLNCTRPLLKVVDDCLPEAAKGLPTLGVKSLLSIADFLCKQSGENIFELANPCLWEDSDDSAEESECEQKIKDFAEKHKNTIPTKTEICTAATSIKSCVQTKAQSSCKNQKTRDIIVGIYDASIAPCSHINEI